MIILLSGGFGQNEDLNPLSLTPLQSMKMEKAKLVEEIRDLDAKLTVLKLNNENLQEIDEISLLREHLFLREKGIAQWIEQSQILDRLIKENQNAVHVYATYNKIPWEKKRPQGFWGNVVSKMSNFWKNLF